MQAHRQPPLLPRLEVLERATGRQCCSVYGGVVVFEVRTVAHSEKKTGACARGETDRTQQRACRVGGANADYYSTNRGFSITL